MITRHERQVTTIRTPDGDEIVIEVMSIRGGRVRLGFTADRKFDIFRDDGLVVVTLAAFPQPPYVPATDHDRRAEVVAFTRAVRSA